MAGSGKNKFPTFFDGKILPPLWKLPPLILKEYGQIVNFSIFDTKKLNSKKSLVIEGQRYGPKTHRRNVSVRKKK